MPYYLNPKQDDFNQELQICIAEVSRFLSLLVSLAPSRPLCPWSAFPQSSDQTGSGGEIAVAKIDRVHH